MISPSFKAVKGKRPAAGLTGIKMVDNQIVNSHNKSARIENGYAEIRKMNRIQAVAEKNDGKPQLFLKSMPGNFRINCFERGRQFRKISGIPFSQEYIKFVLPVNFSQGRQEIPDIPADTGLA